MNFEIIKGRVYELKLFFVTYSSNSSSNIGSISSSGSSNSNSITHKVIRKYDGRFAHRKEHRSTSPPPVSMNTCRTWREEIQY